MKMSQNVQSSSNPGSWQLCNPATNGMDPSSFNSASISFDRLSALNVFKFHSINELTNKEDRS